MMIVEKYTFDSVCSSSLNEFQCVGPIPRSGPWDRTSTSQEQGLVIRRGNVRRERTYVSGDRVEDRRQKSAPGFKTDQGGPSLVTLDPLSSVQVSNCDGV